MSDQQWMHDSELLARAVRGELERGDSELRELFLRRPEWADLLDELADSNDDGPPVELRALARKQSTDTDRERMAALVARVAATDPAATRRRRRWPAPLLLAAAAAAMLGMVWWGQRPTSEVPRGPFLGGDRVSWVAPADTVGAWETFEWEAALPRGGSFSLTVRADDAAGTLLTRAEGLREPRWSPDPITARAWPDSITVTVEVLERSGILQSSVDVALRRSSD